MSDYQRSAHQAILALAEALRIPYWQAAVQYWNHNQRH